VSVQKAILDAGETFLGVLRVGLLTGDLDALAEERIDDDPRGPRRIAIMAMASGAAGRAHLVATVKPDDRMAVVDGDLPFVASIASPWSERPEGSTSTSYSDRPSTSSPRSPSHTNDGAFSRLAAARSHGALCIAPKVPAGSARYGCRIGRSARGPAASIDLFALAIRRSSAHGSLVSLIWPWDGTSWPHDCFG